MHFLSSWLPPIFMVHPWWTVFNYSEWLEFCCISAGHWLLWRNLPIRSRKTTIRITIQNVCLLFFTHHYWFFTFYMLCYTTTKNVSIIHALVCMHEAKTLNSQYLTKGFTCNENTPRSFWFLRDRPPNHTNFDYFPPLSYSPGNKLSKNV